MMTLVYVMYVCECVIEYAVCTLMHVVAQSIEYKKNFPDGTICMSSSGTIWKRTARGIEKSDCETSQRWEMIQEDQLKISM